MCRRKRGLVVVAAAVLLALVAGCAQQMSEQPSLRRMEGTTLFPDGVSGRQPPADTVARGHVQDDALLFTGKRDGQDAAELPFPATRAVLERGRTRFEAFCAPCHGRTGDGDGIVVQRGFSRPPSYHTDRLRSAPVGHFFDVATNGFGSMPPYAKQIPVRDRWAIVAYIRALQLSQNAALTDVPPDARAKLEAQP